MQSLLLTTYRKCGLCAVLWSLKFVLRFNVTWEGRPKIDFHLCDAKCLFLYSTFCKIYKSKQVQVAYYT